MSFRTKRVFIATPFYMLFEFFLLKYFFLLFGGVKDVYLFIATLLLGGLQCIPMIFEEKKSTAAGRFCTEIFGIWQWAIVDDFNRFNCYLCNKTVYWHFTFCSMYFTCCCANFGSLQLFSCS